MSTNKQNNNGFLITVVLIMAVVSAGASFAFYKQLSERVEQDQVRFSRFEQRLQKLTIDNNEKFSFLSKQRLQSSSDNNLAATVDSTPLKHEAKIIKQINDQNRLIGKLLDYSKSMQQQIEKLKRHNSANNLIAASDSSGVGNGVDNDVALEQKPVTIEDMDQEVVMSENQGKEIIRKTENVFQTQSDQGEGGWGAQTNIEIQNAVENIRNTMQYNDLGVNNIDCRGSMCKVELLHSDNKRIEEFELNLLLEMSSDQPIVSTTNSQQLADGKISTTYYLSSETN